MWGVQPEVFSLLSGWAQLPPQQGFLPGKAREGLWEKPGHPTPAHLPNVSLQPLAGWLAPALQRQEGGQHQTNTK